MAVLKGKISFGDRPALALRAYLDVNSVAAVLAETKTDVVPAETERIVQGVSHFSLLSAMSDEVEIKSLIGIIKIDGRRQNVVLNRQNSRD